MVELQRVIMDWLVFGAGIIAEAQSASLFPILTNPPGRPLSSRKVSAFLTAVNVLLIAGSLFHGTNGHGLSFFLSCSCRQSTQKCSSLEVEFSICLQACAVRAILSQDPLYLFI